MASGASALNRGGAQLRDAATGIHKALGATSIQNVASLSACFHITLSCASPSLLHAFRPPEGPAPI